MGRFFYFASEHHSGSRCGKGVVGVGGGTRESYESYTPDQQKDKDDKVVVFVLCHNDESRASATTSFAPYDWARPQRIPTTYMMETFFYTNLLPSLLDTAINPNTRWIGSLSWKAPQKTSIPLVHEMLTDPALAASDVDVLAFFIHSPHESMAEYSNRAHPGLIEAMEYILLSVGETKKDVQSMRADPSVFKPFYANYLVARPSLMRTYVAWLSRVVLFLNIDPRAQKMAWVDSRYDPAIIGGRHCSQDVFNLPYYPMHPFIGERLAPYFFHTRKAKILTIMEYQQNKDSQSR